MAPSRFTPTTRGTILERIAAGCTHAEAATAGGVSATTLRNWLRRGRREDGGEYSDFEAKVREAHGVAEARPEVITEDELWHEVSKMVRNGSVSAAKLAHEMFEAKRKRDGDGADKPADPLADLDPPTPDELAARRQAKGAAGK